MSIAIFSNLFLRLLTTERLYVLRIFFVLFNTNALTLIAAFISQI